MKITLLTFVVCFVATTLYGSQDFLVLSGGISPRFNHYSNYKQTITLSEFLIAKFGENSVSIMFGAGNTIDTPTISPDVHKVQIIADDLKLDMMVYGVFKNNSEATENNVKKFLNFILNNNTNNPFFLFVSGHGIPNRNDQDFSDNCIALWGYDEENMQQTHFDDICFSRKEFESLIRDNNSNRKTIFVMAQCYSGGFHKISVKIEDGFPIADPNVCGYTSSTEDAMSSGCVSGIDGTNYQGYERYFTEQLTGKNIVTGEEIPNWKNHTIHEAHLSASLKDLTIDVPLSTTDYYLREWSKIFTNPSFIPRTPGYDASEINEQLEHYSSLHFEDRDLHGVEDDLLLLINTKHDHLRKMQVAVIEKFTDLTTVFQSNSIEALRQKYQQIKRYKNDVVSLLRELQQEYLLQYDVVEWFWRESILNGDVSYLLKEEIDFEINVIPNLDKPYLLFLSKITKENKEHADIISHYQAKSYNYMINHALTYGVDYIRKSAQKMQDNLNDISRVNEKYQLLNQQAGLVRRIILMREQLAVLIILAKSGDLEAIGDIRNLENCIHTEPSFDF